MLARLFQCVGSNGYLTPWKLEPVIERYVADTHRGHIIDGTALVDVQFHPCYQYGYLPDRGLVLHCNAVLVESLELDGQQHGGILVVPVAIDPCRTTHLLYEGNTIGLVQFECHLDKVGQSTLLTRADGGQHVDFLYEDVPALLENAHGICETRVLVDCLFCQVGVSRCPDS